MSLHQALSDVCSTPLPRIHVLSDLHLETGPYELPPGLEFDVLVAAGDIGPIDVAVPWLVSLNKPVVYVLGNHERWGHDIAGAVHLAKRLARGSLVQVLEKESVVMCGTRFLGATLWTALFEKRPDYVNAVWRHMRDYTHIKCNEWVSDPKNLTALTRQIRAMRAHIPEGMPADGCLHPLVTYVEHKSTLTWLNRMLKRDCELPTVVVTHHAPSFESLRRNGIREEYLAPHRWGYRDVEPARVAAYASQVLRDSLTDSQKSTIALWIHGHTHRHMNYVEDGVQVLCNPRGHKTQALTVQSASAYALFGVGFSAEDIERSQLAHAAEPFAGDAWDFDKTKVLSLALGNSDVVAALTAEPLEELNTIAAELRDVSLVAGQGTGTKDECVTRWFEHLLRLFNDQLDIINRQGLQVQDGSETHIFRRLQTLPTAHLWTPVGEDRPYGPADFQRAMETVESALERAALVPSALLRYLKTWALVSLQCLVALESAGLTAHCVALSPRAFRQAQEVELAFLVEASDANDSEQDEEGLYQRVEALLDSTLNPKGPPRVWLPRFYFDRARVQNRLLSKAALQQLADLEGAGVRR